MEKNTAVIITTDKDLLESLRFDMNDYKPNTKYRVTMTNEEDNKVFHIEEGGNRPGDEQYIVFDNTTL